MASPVAVVDTLNSLLEAQLNSVFRFMGEGSPYLGRASAEVRRPLAEMVEAGGRRARALAELIESFGLPSTPQAAIRSDEQYLSFLSLKFLLPKLVAEKRIQIERYENALRTIPKSAPEIRALLQEHVAELGRELSQLEKSSDEAIAAARAEGI